MPQPSASPAHDYARRLLMSLNEVLAPEQPVHEDAVAAWARSGAMALTGRPDGPPLVHQGPAVALQGALAALRALAPATQLPGVELLGERAALAGLVRQGDRACGGGTRLLPCQDGWVALTLSRATDLELVPALVEAALPTGGEEAEWTAVTAWLHRTPAAAAVARARLLGLALTALGERHETLPWSITPVRNGAPPERRPVVVVLGSLWAGPLAGSLLAMLGCDVAVVEDPQRPDGTRTGCPSFYELLHRDVQQVPLDLADSAGRAALHDLLRTADAVVEGSRPRALAQLGLPAERLLDEADLTWVSVTAHGREQGDRVGYGDDCAVAGGLVALDHDGPVFVGDAVADPLTGVHAALALWSGVQRGGARLVDLPLSRVAAVAADFGGERPTAVRHRGGWRVARPDGPVDVLAPHTRDEARTAACC